MNRARILSSLTLAAAVALGGLTPAPAEAADEVLTMVSTDTSAYPDVRMVVAVPGQLGDQALADVAVTVVEGGQRPAVRFESLRADQLEVALLIDTSGSMVGAPLAAAKAAAQSFLAQLPASVPVSVIGFGASARVVSPRSSSRQAEVAAIKALTAEGQTALYDAVGTALSQLPDSGARRVAVLLTDGGDTASTATLGATADAMAMAKVPLFAVELRTAESNPGALSRLTSASGGRVVPAADPAALVGAFDSIARQLVRQYAVTYRSAANGGTDIDVIVEARGLRAVAHPHVDLPAAASGAVVAPLTSAQAARPAPASSLLGAWALVVGGGLFGAGLLGLLLGFARSRTPKARGLAARRRGATLDGAVVRAESLSDRVFGRQGGVAAVNQKLELAGVDVRPGELLMGVAATTLVLFAAGWALVGPLVGLVVALMAPLLARIVLDILATRRRKKFTDQMADTLQILAGSLRAGHGLAQGIETVAREAEVPTAEEFRRLTIEVRLGRDLVDSLSALAERVGSEDFTWVVQAVQIQREIGGDLAEILDTVASTVRDRTRIRRQVSALSAEGRMSAWVLMVLPFGLTAIMVATSRDYVNPLFKSGMGLRLVGVGVALLVVGGLWLRRIVKPIF
jgi:tight adherence protein B